MNVFVTGGSKSGKSARAEEAALRLSAGGERYYVATMIPCDGEDRARVARHVAARAGLGFITLELGRDVERCLELGSPGATYLIESVTALMMNEMYPQGRDPDPEGMERCIEGLLEVARRAGNAVFVSDYIFSDAAHYDSYTENYRAALGRAARALAAACDVVLEVTAGLVTVHKGVWECEKTL